MSTDLHSASSWGEVSSKTLTMDSSTSAHECIPGCCGPDSMCPHLRTVL
jgi:hypothetical protein